MKKQVIIVMMTMFLLMGCSNNNKNDIIENNNDTNNTEDVNNNIDEHKINVIASTYPMYYIAKEIGRDKINLDILVPIGVDPHEYEISLKQIKDLENTDLFLYNGSGLEHWGEKISKNLSEKNKSIINASKYVDLLDVENDHSHESQSDHDHGDKDPHIWLDPMNLEKTAKVVCEQLKKLDKENSENYDANYLELSKKLKKLDNRYKTELKSKKQDTILVSHKAFAYLANRYGLKQIAVTGISPHSEPSPKSLSKLIDITKEKNIKYIFFEVLSSPKSVEMIASEADLEVLTLNPIGGITTDQFKSGIDYIDLMEENLENLKKALVN